MLISEKPKFPHYAVYAKRMESFKAWPDYFPVKKEDLAEAGLVYTGVGDGVRCYFCGAELRNWEQGDIPMKEHAKWYPRCPHVLLKTGQGNGSMKQVDKFGYEFNPYKSVAAQSCLENDYPEDKVNQAVDIYIQRNGGCDFKGRDLCAILFELEENHQDTSCATVTPTVASSEHITSFEVADISNVYNMWTEDYQNYNLAEDHTCTMCRHNSENMSLLAYDHLVRCVKCVPVFSFLQANFMIHGFPYYNRLRCKGSIRKKINGSYV